MIATQSHLTTSSDVVASGKRKSTTSTQQNNTLTAVQSHTRPVVTTSSLPSLQLSASTTTTTPTPTKSNSPATDSTRSLLQTTISNRNTSQITNSRRSPRNESPRKSSRRVSSPPPDISTRPSSGSRQRRQTSISQNSTNTPGTTRTKKEKLLCVCRTPYDDTK